MNDPIGRVIQFIGHDINWVSFFSSVGYSFLQMCLDSYLPSDANPWDMYISPLYASDKVRYHLIVTVGLLYMIL